VNLILLEPEEAGAGGIATLTGTRADHMRTVLRVSPGQTVRIGVLDGPPGSATVMSMDEGAVTLRCAFEAAAPPAPAVDLLLALPRPKVMRRLWAQLAAIGVRRIMVTNAERVERHYFDTHVLEPACYRPLLIEGLQQARDTRMPIVTIHRRLKVLVEDQLDEIAGPGIRLVADADGPATIADMIASGRDDRVLLAVGPEGGWNPFELALLERHGFIRIGMGARTLRSDTATIALLALVHAARTSAQHR
jgi:RsmE family RNA methyltransferase